MSYLIMRGHHWPDKIVLCMANVGTLEFTSRDVHLGKYSRRGELEALAFNMLKWSSGKLPWETEAELKNYDAVEIQKIKFLNDVPKLFTECYGETPPCPGLGQFFNYIQRLGFAKTPKYSYIRQFLHKSLLRAGFDNDGKLDIINATC
uniref:Uncharacterized protein n=1 Tax=Strigamia maritima TaxID=126957 RepID=T1J3Y8_STRMM